MAKENTESTPKPLTKKHEARVEKENRQKKFLLIGIISILILVVALIVYGILDSTVLKQGKAVAKVDSTTITVDQFEKRVQYERLSQVELFTTYAASPYAMFFQDSLLQMQNSLDNYLQFGSDTLDTMISEVVLAKKAEELGITVTDEDINKEIERGFSFYPEGTPTSAPTVEYRPTSTFSPTQLALVTLTPTPTLEPTATSIPATPTVEVTAAEGETETAAGTVTAEPATPTSEVTEVTPTEEPTATSIPPTATPYTRAGFESAYQGMITSINDNFPYTDTDFRAYVRNLLINQKMFDYVNTDVTQDQDMVWARHILVATEEEANAVLEKLSAGQDWSTLCAGFSTDTASASNGGDLGWFYKGQMTEAFEAEAFKLAIGEISKPVKTDFGYHIIQVLGHEVRQLSDDQYTTLKSNNFNKFIEAAKAEYKIKKFDIWAKIVPNTPAISDQYRIADTATAQ